MSFPSKLSFFGGQIIVLKDVTFAAQGNGVEGASVIAGGSIDGTSNTDVGLCGSGMEDNFVMRSVQIAR